MVDALDGDMARAAAISGPIASCIAGNIGGLAFGVDYAMRGMLAWLMGVAWLYVAWRWVHPLPGGIGVHVVVALVLLMVAEYHTIARRWFGARVVVELPRPAMVVLAWAFGAFVLLTLLLVGRDVVGLIVFGIAGGPGRAILTGGMPPAIIGALAACLSAWGTWQGTKVPRVKTVRLDLPDLPAAFDGYELVQLSDVHASALLPEAWIAAVVVRVNALDPDLIVMTGDLADGTPQVRALDVHPFAHLQARDGVLAIPGNHEYYADYKGWMPAYRALGLHMLENAHVLIERNGAQIAIAGVTDRQAVPFGELAPDLASALAGVASGIPVILLDHRPGNARTNAEAGVALQLSGHTHGGQLPGLAWLVRRTNAGFASGWYRVGAMQLYVSKGTGLWSGFALRLGVSSEITRLVLHAAAR